MITTMFNLIDLAKQVDLGHMTQTQINQIGWQYLGISLFAIGVMLGVTNIVSLIAANFMKK